MRLINSLSAAAIVAVLGLSQAAMVHAMPMTISPDPESTRISVVVKPNLSHTNKLPTRALRDARKAMIAKEPVSEEDLRALADHNDGLAAARYAAILRDRDPVTHASDIAHYYSIAAGTGRIYALKPMIEAMHRLDPETESRERKAQLISVLYPHAWAGNALALDAVIAFNGEGKLFGALSQATRDKIVEHGQGGSGRFELKFALEILEAPEKTRADLDRARNYLEAASESRILGIQAAAKTLLSRMDEDTAGEARITQ